jgi:RNA polymerase sigma factor (sigma-70 family)
MKGSSPKNQLPVNIPEREDRGIFRMNWHFYSWERNRWDYKIIALFLDGFRDIVEASRFLNQANSFLLPGHNYFFDGTIRCLQFLLNNHMINLELISDGHLRDLLKRFSANPHDPISIPISSMGNSFQALTCKMVPINIRSLQDKIRIDASCTDTIDFLQHGTTDDLVDPNGKAASIVNRMWVLLGSNPWNLDVTRNISEFILEQTVESLQPETGLFEIFAIIEPLIRDSAKEYFPDYSDIHPARIALRYAAMMVFYNALDNHPVNVKQDRSVWPVGLIDPSAEDVAWYILTSNRKLKGWFKTYFMQEMDKRAKLIAATRETKVGHDGNEYIRYFYFPVYEFFRFINVNYLPRIWGCLRIFSSRDFSIIEKDEIAKCLVFSIQNVVLQFTAIENRSQEQSDHNKRLLEHENSVYQPLKEALESFLLRVIEPMRKRIFTSLASEINQHMKLGESQEDIYQIIFTEAIITILEYDDSINDSFFGYLKATLSNRIRSKLRLKKFDAELVVRDGPDEDDDKNDAPNGIVESCPSIDEEIDMIQLQRAISSVLVGLTSKERAVIEKAFFKNKTLSETERRMKNRTLGKMKAKHKNLEEFLGSG